MVRYRKVNGKIIAYSKWYDHKNFGVDYDVNMFKNKKDLIDWYLSEKNATRYVVQLNDYIKSFVTKNKFKNIVSFGSGVCVQEYLLKKDLPKDYTVVATDYNKEAIEKAQSFFPEPELICRVFDLKKDSVVELERQLGLEIDFAFLVNSAYVMDDKRFISFFKELNECGVGYVIDASGGIIYNKRVVPWYLHRIINAGYYIFHGNLKYSERYVPEDRPFGYARTIPELLKLYRAAGYTVIDSFANRFLKDISREHIGLLKKINEAR